MERLLALDTETTGLEISEGHRIIDVAAVEILDRKITGSIFREFIQPNRTVGESVNVHGITDKELIGMPQFVQISDDFLSFIEGATLVIHNAPFDLGFLNNELKIIGITEKIESMCKIIDTLELSKKLRPGGIHTQDAIARRYEIDVKARKIDSGFTQIKDKLIHRALSDAKILAEMYLAMTAGQFDLALDTANTESNQSDPSLIKKIKENRDKIKVIYANNNELEAHENYFQN
jgi:DNA polymerase-3 subunit epsilon